MKIIRHREHHEVAHYFLSFERLDHPGSGFSFPCDESGDVKVNELNPEARKNYDNCLAGKGVEHGRLEEYHHHYVTSSVGICDDCGEEVELTGFTNTCCCGADYNMSGQRLAPREQWGEETNESVEDILSVDYTDTDSLLNDF